MDGDKCCGVGVARAFDAIGDAIVVAIGVKIVELFVSVAIARAFHRNGDAVANSREVELGEMSC